MAQALNIQADVVGGELLFNIFEGLRDLYEQGLLEPPFVDSIIITHLPEGKSHWALPRADVVDLMGRAALVRAELAACMPVEGLPCWA